MEPTTCAGVWVWVPSRKRWQVTYKATWRRIAYITPMHSAGSGVFDQFCQCTYTMPCVWIQYRPANSALSIFNSCYHYFTLPLFSLLMHPVTMSSKSWQFGKHWYWFQYVIHTGSAQNSALSTFTILCQWCAACKYCAVDICNMLGTHSTYQHCTVNNECIGWA